MASVQLSNYEERIGQAQAIIDRLTDGEPPASEILSGLVQIKRMLPAVEDVEVGGRFVRVDNRWLHEAADNVIKNIDGDTDERWTMLIDIFVRLSSLQDRLEKSASPAVVQTEDHQARLEQILARPEYRLEEAKESTIRKWFQRLMAALDNFLSGLVFDRQKAPTGSVMVPGFRIFLLVLLLAALIIGLFQLMNRLRSRSKSEKEKDTRQVLGEEIEANLTSAEILARANELARQGDYRSAIRRAYIALLYELELRGKLRLHRSKTNRDYLEAIRREQALFPVFSTMTRTFETVWYGQITVSGEHFDDFVSCYHQTVEKS
ncbi:MAG: DUF4129 domain-containing protein [Acidobacteria bacterium]|nr:DUF4129 domain-containing protein [Acidobacteriota bacterium]